MAKTTAFDQHTEAYENWFTRNSFAYESELEAVRYFIPDSAKGVEIGVGSGLFAAPNGIRYGVEPSAPMREKAKKRGIEVYDGVAENLPFEDETFDFTLMVTTICFVDDAEKTFREAYRILRPGGRCITGFVDKNSPLGRQYQQMKESSTFYNEASFFSAAEIFDLLERTGFRQADTAQTVFGTLDEIKEIQPFKPGYGEGSFVVIAAEKT